MSRNNIVSAAIILLAGTNPGLSNPAAIDSQVKPMVVSPAVILGDTSPSLIRIQANAEEEAWQALGDDASPVQLMIFLENFPGGAFETQAKRRLLSALDPQTQAAAEPEPEAAAQATVAPEPKTDATVSPASLPAEAPAVDDGIVRFSVPLFHGDSHIAGKSLEQLIAGSPTFPPIEGLPEEYWKEQTCSNCHEWTQANLCEQATFYTGDAGAANLTKQHPYGGTFKQNLRNWAKGDCQ